MRPEGEAAISIDVIRPIIGAAAEQALVGCTDSSAPNHIQFLPVNEPVFSDLRQAVSGLGGQDLMVRQVLEMAMAEGVKLPVSQDNGRVIGYLPALVDNAEAPTIDPLQMRPLLDPLDDLGPEFIIVGQPGLEPSYLPCKLPPTSELMVAKEPEISDCARPAQVDYAKLEASTISTQLRSVFVSALGFGLSKDMSGNPFLDKMPFCAPDTVATAAHCSGFLMPDDVTVLTALHCMKVFGGIEAGPKLEQLAVGESSACPDGANIVVLLDKAVLRGGTPLPEEIRSCRSLQRVSTDMVKILLDSPFSLPQLATSVAFTSPRQEGMRLISQGYPQVPIPMTSKGGRLLPIRNCLTTLAFKLGFRPPEETWGDLEIGGYGCASIDTANGMSGGAVFAITEDSSGLGLLGIVSAAFEFDPNQECRAMKTEIVPEDCGTNSPDHNVIEFVQR